MKFGDGNMMNNRYIGVFFLLPLLIFLFLGGIYLKYAVLVLSLLGMYEFYKVVKSKNFHPFSILGYLACIFYYFILGSNYDLKLTVFIVIILSMIALIIPVINVKYNFIESALTILGFLYVGAFFSFIYLLDIKPGGKFLVWLIFISSWSCDTLAYYVGKYLGKNKLCPEVSPKKTIEGSIGGLLGSIIGCGIYGYIYAASKVNINIIHFLLIGALSGILCQFGDLVASSIKRYCGVKDYSHIIPGHGGILDRFDSILFAGVIVYYYITIIMGI